MGERGEMLTANQFFWKTVKLLNAELDAWRRRYPDAARFVEEEARAKVEGREPNYPPPIVRGKPHA